VFQPNVIDLKSVGEKGSGIDVFKNSRAQVQVVDLTRRVYTGFCQSGINKSQIDSGYRAAALETTQVSS
jgi:hypothetical protein